MTHRIMVRGSVSPFLYIWLKGKLSKNGTEGILVKKKERERERKIQRKFGICGCVTEKAKPKIYQ